MNDWKMSSVTWGMELQAMVRNEAEADKGRNQRTNLYMTVPDMTKEIKRLEKLGAEIFKGPEAVPGMGQWAYVKVPGDVVLGLWVNDPGFKPPARAVTKKPGDHGTPTFFEFVNSDAKEVAQFFKKAYGWDFQEMPFHGAPYWYTSDPVTKAFSAGIRHPKKGEKDRDLITFVNVDDFEGQTAKMTKSGSKKVGKVVNYDPHGEYQLLTVPGNHTLGLWGSPKKDAGNSAEKAESASAATVPKGKGRAAKSAALSKINTKRSAETTKTSKKPAKKARKE
jgi:predicted enzyme related to lactoylglutathione lyase